MSDLILHEALTPEILPSPDTREDDDLKYAQHLLLMMVRQNCKKEGKEEHYFSGFLSIHAEVLSYLCKIGKLDLVSDNGGRVVSAKEKA